MVGAGDDRRTGTQLNAEANVKKTALAPEVKWIQRETFGMDRALALVSGTDTDRRLLAEAGSLAGGVKAKLFVLDIVDAAEYGGDVQRRSTIGRRSESPEEAAERARENASSVAEEVLSDLDVEYEARGIVGDVPEDVLSEAERLDCDHVFVVGRRRSPTGKAIFGDVAQSVVLGFDGPVTVLLGE